MIVSVYVGEITLVCIYIERCETPRLASEDERKGKNNISDATTEGV